MNKAELHDFIAKNQPNICQMAIYYDGRAVYSDEWNGYTETDCTHPEKNIYAAIGNSGNVIYVNPEQKMVVAVSSYFKPTIFDRIDFIEESVVSSLPELKSGE